MSNRSSTQIALSAVLVFVIGLLISVLLFASVRHLEHEKADIDFLQRAQMRVAAVEGGVADAMHVLADVHQLFVSFGTVSREQFRTFSQPLLARNPSIQALNFHRVIQRDQRAAYEATMQAQFPGFTIKDISGPRPIVSPPKDHYRVVDYIEPMAGNRAALGVDADSYSFQQAALRKAMDTGEPSATGLLTLTQAPDKQKGVIVVMPLYRGGVLPADVAARRHALIGDVAAVFRSGDMIAKSLDGNGIKELSPAQSDVEVSVYASSQADDNKLVFRTHQMPPRASSYFGLPSWFLYDQPTPYRHQFDVAGQTWFMEVSTAPIFFINKASNALWALLAGLLFSVGAAIYLQLLIDRSRRIQLLVDERTAQLRAVNEDLNADIAARKRAEQALQLRERAIEASANAIVITEAVAPHYPIEYVNPAFERITGYTPAEVIGRDSCFLWGEDTEQPGIKEIRAAAAELREGHAVLRSYRKDGSLFWSDTYIAPVRDENGTVSHFVSAQYDITATKRYESELEFQTNRDALTGLANRNLLRDRLSQAISYAYRYSHPIWLLFIDLDRFKFINDTLGHRAGDMLLKAVATRLQATVRETDTIARLGSDEFVLILPERTDAGLSTGIVQRIMDAIAQPLLIEGHEFFITSSIGVAVYPADGESPEELLKHADIAMYRAKETGRSNFQFYTSTMNERALERLRIESDLRNALERDEFVLYYQPQIDLRSNQIVGVEALIRWQHPEWGIVPPARFITLAEETGMIVPIGAWVIRTACMQAKAWQQRGLGNLRISVNLSARQFAQQDLVESVAQALSESGLDPTCLEIELTESLVMADVDHAIRILRELKALGVTLSIDDFGTGYSSLSYLKRFPIDVLKIDRSFVNDISVDTDNAAIVSSIISLAHSLRLLVIAEGVETQSQLNYLRENGCDQMQGYFFSRPVPAADLAQMCAEGKRL
jgi:diguanylate cyclase (GGDEF)-like protein/PAS domain S-box-containing protein